MNRITLAVCLVVACRPATAGYVDGNRLHAQCKSSSTSSTDRAISYGYITGISDLAGDSKLGTPAFCTPPNVSLGQVRDVVCQWIDRNPQHRHEQAHTLVVAALLGTWPCPKQ